MEHKIFKICILSLLLCVSFEKQAFACFTGYEEVQKYASAGILGPPFVFSPELGKTIQKVMTDMDYHSLVSSPLTGKLSFLTQRKIAVDQNSWQGRTALYFTESSVIKYYMLLEMVRVFDPCFQQLVIDEDTHNKVLREGYLDTVALPTGYSLTTYEKHTKNHVEQVVVLTSPRHPQSLVPFPQQEIVSRAFYPLEMESYLKPYLLEYLTANIPSWTAQPIELPDAN